MTKAASRKRSFIICEVLASHGLVGRSDELVASDVVALEIVDSGVEVRRYIPWEDSHGHVATLVRDIQRLNPLDQPWPGLAKDRIDEAHGCHASYPSALELMVDR